MRHHCQTCSKSMDLCNCHTPDESEINVSEMELGETQAALLELVEEGTVFATQERTRGRVTFVAAQYATDEDKEFTKGWLEHPYFGTH